MTRGRGSLPSASAGGTVAAHVAEADPHTQYTRRAIDEIIAGGWTFGNGVDPYTLTIDSGAGDQGDIEFKDGGTLRWKVRKTGGMNFGIEAYDAAGALIDEPIAFINAAGGAVEFKRRLEVFTNTILFRDPPSDCPIVLRKVSSGNALSICFPSFATNTADRTFTFVTGDEDRSVTLSGDLTIDVDTTISAFGATLVDDADAAAARATLGAADIVHTHATTDTVSGVFADARIAESNITQHVAAIDHNSLLNFLIAEHRVINDAGTGTTDLWSASKITDELSAAVNSLDFKDGVETVADSNITLSGEQTINGFLTSTSRVGVVGQTVSEDNGIYVTAAGAWARSTDVDVSSEVTQGLTFFVSDTSSTKNGFQYILTTPDPIVLGTTPLSFTEVKRIELGTTAGTAAEGNDGRIPVQDENDALIGTNGTPSSANKYVTNSDTRIPVQDENDALVGTNGTPSSANKYVTNSDARNSDSRVPSGTAGGDLNGSYPNPLVDDGADATAIHNNTSGEIAAIATKATIVGADLVMIENSEDSNSKAKTTLQDIANLAGAALDNNFVFSFDTTTQAIASANTYQGLDFATNGELNGWTHVVGTSIFGCNQTGKYRVTVDITWQKSTGGTASLGMRALFDAAEVAGSMQGSHLTSNNESMMTSKTFIVNATTAQNLEIEVASSTTNVSVLPGPDPGGATADVSASITITRIK